MGAVFQGPDAPPRTRYALRLRRTLPALAFLLSLCVLAGLTWLRVLDRVEDRAAACTESTTTSSSKIQVRVYNATAREGLARRIAGQLVGRGYVIVATDNDPLSGIRPVEAAAEVRYGPAGARQAAQVRRQVPGARLYKDARQGPIVDLVLGEKFVRLATPAELTRGRQGLVAPAPTASAAKATSAAAKASAARAPAGRVPRTTAPAAPSPSRGC